MHSLFARARTVKHAYPSSLKSPKLASVSDRNMAYPPKLKIHRPQMQRANYYWAANYQTVQIFSALLDSSIKNPHPDDAKKINTVMVELLEALIEHDGTTPTDPASFEKLVKSHLNGLDVKQLDHLAHSLKKYKFKHDCYQIIFEIVERNGRKKERESVIALQTTDQLFVLLEDLIKNSAVSNNNNQEVIFPANWNELARKILSDSAAAWHADKKNDDVANSLLKVARELASNFGMSELPEAREYSVTNSLHSSLTWQGASLQCDARLKEVLSHQNKNTKQTYKAPFERALRDVLELILMKKIYGSGAELASLSAAQLHNLREKIDLVINQTSPAASDDLRNLAKEVMKKAASFGHIYISPNGSGSGHSWIGPDFSIFPNNEDGRQKLGGSVFMQDAKQLSPSPKKIKERSVQFISYEKNEKYFPNEEALIIKVPVPADVLQRSAQQVKDRWIKEDIPYRAMASIDGEDVHSCRVGVWEAVCEGMDEPARQLFVHYNRGVPDPDSSAELWLRMQGYMQWIEALAGEV